jgi:hypothetical protein
MQRMEQERTRLREPGPRPWPWHEPAGPMPGAPADIQAGQPDRTTQAPIPPQAPITSGDQSGSALADGAGAPAQGPYAPPSWDNLWYYRGY